MRRPRQVPESHMALIAVFALTFLWTQSPLAGSCKINLTWFISLTGIVTVSLTAFVYRRITLSYWLGIQSLYMYLKEQASTE
jgi:hypothetical protein